MITWNAYEMAGHMVCAVGELRDEVDILTRALVLAGGDTETFVSQARAQFEADNDTSPR